ncbi:MAG: hypothetical protein Q9211_004021 [Gyalolechia sp. 1 TL-2023]
MPFRDKVKKAFGKSTDDPSETNSDLSLQSKPSTKKSKKRKVEYPENVYKPGEIPESKYKGPYNKAHQQKLHAFSFGAAFQGRRKSSQSNQSLYSPMGSRLPSRVGSFMSRRSFGPKSRQPSRVEDTLMENNEADDAVENEKEREEVRPPTQESQHGDGVRSFGTNESMMMNGFGTHSTAATVHIDGLDQNHMTNSNSMDGLESTKTLTNDSHQQASFGQPFSADDLVHAMTQSTLKPSAVQA